RQSGPVTLGQSHEDSRQHVLVNAHEAVVLQLRMRSAQSHHARHRHRAIGAGGGSTGFRSHPALTRVRRGFFISSVHPHPDRMMRYLLPLLLCAATTSGSLLAQQPGGRWDGVAQALGRGGATAGETYRATFPRSDLQVRVGDVAVTPALALTSWAAFAGSADTADVMGDLVLAEREVPIVTNGLLGAGFDVTGIHHHLLGESPRVVYLHYHGHGPAVQLATRLRQVLARTATPLTEEIGRAHV